MNWLPLAPPITLFLPVIVFWAHFILPRWSWKWPHWRCFALAAFASVTASVLEILFAADLFGRFGQASMSVVIERSAWDAVEGVAWSLLFGGLWAYFGPQMASPENGTEERDSAIPQSEDRIAATLPKGNGVGDSTADTGPRNGS